MAFSDNYQNGKGPTLADMGEKARLAIEKWNADYKRKQLEKKYRDLEKQR